MTHKHLNFLLDTYGFHWCMAKKAHANFVLENNKQVMEKVSKMIWEKVNNQVLPADDSNLIPISMPESFDDLVKIHGKDVIRDWLKAMLK